MDKFEIQKYLYYILIAIISLIMVVFMPMVGTEVGMEMNVPDTVAGWIVWVIIKLSMAVMNVLLFHCFMQQAVVNVQDDDKYKEAREILLDKPENKFVPMSPEKWIKKQYLTKATTVFITSAVSVFALTQAVLKYDTVSMLTYIVTLILGVVFGVLQMKTAECYWTNEFWQYAKMIEKEKNEDVGEERKNIPES